MDAHLIAVGFLVAGTALPILQARRFVLVEHRAYVERAAAYDALVFTDLLPAPPACKHGVTVPVEAAVTGELVARICKFCGDQLPA